MQVDWFFSDDESEDFSNFPFSLPQDSTEAEPASANHNLLLSNIQKVEGGWQPLCLIDTRNEGNSTRVSLLINSTRVSLLINSTRVSLLINSTSVTPYKQH